MDKIGKYLLLLMLLAAPLGRGVAQTGTPVLPSREYPADEFPLWARDLRRAEIVAFGSFPFTVLFGTMAVETIVYFNHDQDPRYRPWPFKPAGGVGLSRDNRFLALEVAAAASVLISLADFIIVQVKRNRAAIAARKLPDGTPIITRRPWPETMGDAGTPETVEPGGPEEAVPADPLSPEP